MKFSSEFWAESESQVEFIPTSVSADGLPITAVVVYIFEKDQLLLTKIGRGWDLPGGHIERGETPEDALVREVREETGCAVKNIAPIGYLKITNIRENDRNRRYPKTSCILVYAGSDLHLKDGPLEFEATEIKLVPFEEIGSYHHNWTELKQQILVYALGNDTVKES